MAPDEDAEKTNEKQMNEPAASRPEEPKADTKPEPGPAKSDADNDPPTETKPLPHEIAAALDNDVMLMLDAVVHAATDDVLRRCPSLASICQAYQINRQSMIDWLERVKVREAQRAERYKADAEADKASKKS